MAFSGAQKTRLGLGGFSRALYGSFAGKSEKTDADRSFAVSAIISDRGKGVSGPIYADGLGVLGAITTSFSVSSIMSERGQGLSCPIDETGQGVKGTV